jgi:hypothetical protein
MDGQMAGHRLYEVVACPSPSRFWRPSSIHQPGLTQVLLYCQHTSCTLTTRDPSAITSSSSSAPTSSSSPSVLSIPAVPICTASYYCNYCCNYCCLISTSTSAYSPLAQPTPARCTAKKRTRRLALFVPCRPLTNAFWL